MASVGALPQHVECPVTSKAQQFLDAAFQSVHSAFDAFDLLRKERSVDGKAPRGRLTDAEEDLLRSAVMFAGAGIDSTLKQLIRDATFLVTGTSKDANKKLHKFSADFLSEGDLGVSPSRLAAILLKGGLALPRESLIEEYEKSLTGGSLQSSQEVDGVCGALAVNKSALRARLGNGKLLDEMFRARNQMVHELDLLPDRKPGRGVRMKRARKIEQTESWVTEVLSVAQEILNEVAASINDYLPTLDEWDRDMILGSVGS